MKSSYIYIYIHTHRYTAIRYCDIQCCKWTDWDMKLKAVWTEVDRAQR